MKMFTRLLVVLIISLQLVSVPTFAQDKKSYGGPRKQVATIVFSGLAGAVLGLSTLSFYGRPQDRLSNIAVGFALGVIVGSIATTYGATQSPDQFYGREALLLQDFELNQEEVHANNSDEIIGFKYSF